MTKRFSINISWDDEGNIVLNFDRVFKDNSIYGDSMYYCGLALIDHLFVTLCFENVIYFSKNIIKAIHEKKYDSSSIGEELRSVTIEFHSANDYLYTIFKPRTKLFANNLEIENDLCQLVINVISKALCDTRIDMNEYFRAAVLGLFVSYMRTLKADYDNHASAFEARKHLGELAILFLNKFPGGFKDDGLYSSLLPESLDLIDRLSNFPASQNEPILACF